MLSINLRIFQLLFHFFNGIGNFIYQLGNGHIGWMLGTKTKLLVIKNYQSSYHISRHLERYNIFTPKQHGFRKHHSCVTQLILSAHDWAQAVDAGHQVDIAIFDFSKAFDCVPHERLKAELHMYGIRGKFILNWIINFLTKRKQRVVINGTSSDWDKVDYGVPQGTVLGPLLFYRIGLLMTLLMTCSQKYDFLQMTTFCIKLSTILPIVWNFKTILTSLTDGVENGKCSSMPKNVMSWIWAPKDRNWALTTSFMDRPWTQSTITNTWGYSCHTNLNGTCSTTISPKRLTRSLVCWDGISGDVPDQSRAPLTLRL